MTAVYTHAKKSWTITTKNTLLVLDQDGTGTELDQVAAVSSAKAYSGGHFDKTPVLKFTLSGDPNKFHVMQADNFTSSVRSKDLTVNPCLIKLKTNPAAASLASTHSHTTINIQRHANYRAHTTCIIYITSTSPKFLTGSVGY